MVSKRQKVMLRNTFTFRTLLLRYITNIKNMCVCVWSEVCLLAQEGKSWGMMLERPKERPRDTIWDMRVYYYIRTGGPGTASWTRLHTTTVGGGRGRGDFLYGVKRQKLHTMLRWIIFMPPAPQGTKPWSEASAS